MSPSSSRRTPRAFACGALAVAITLAGCTPPSDEHPPAPQRTPTLAPPPPVVSDAQIVAPDEWALLPDETAVHSWSGRSSETVELPVADLGLIFVMYASCSGGATMTVTTTSASPSPVEPWEIECDAVPTRREVHTDESTRATALRLTVEGEGSWGFLLANAATQ